jgi:hypothetical protein
MLDPQKFARLAGDKPGFDPRTSVWVPADNRDVPGSQYAAEITTQVPDLRGVFLRGLNKFEERRTRDKDKDPDGDSRVAGSLQLDTNVVYVPQDKQKGGFDLAAATGPAPVAVRIRTTAGEDAEENHPKNVAIYYYIKIN